MPAKKQVDLEQMEKVLDLMQAKGVHKFSLGDLTVEFDMMGPTEAPAPTVTYNLDDPEERAAALRQRLESAASAEEEALLWSVGK